MRSRVSIRARARSLDKENEVLTRKTTSRAKTQSERIASDPVRGLLWPNHLLVVHATIKRSCEGRWAWRSASHLAPPAGWGAGANGGPNVRVPPHVLDHKLLPRLVVLPTSVPGSAREADAAVAGRPAGATRGASPRGAAGGGLAEAWPAEEMGACVRAGGGRGGGLDGTGRSGACHREGPACRSSKGWLEIRADVHTTAAPSEWVSRKRPCLQRTLGVCLHGGFRCA